MEEVPRRTSLVPLAFPCFVLGLIWGGNRRAFRLPGAGGGSFPLYGGTDHIQCRGLVILYRLWPENIYLGNSAGADCTLQTHRKTQEALKGTS